MTPSPSVETPRKRDAQGDHAAFAVSRVVGSGWFALLFVLLVVLALFSPVRNFAYSLIDDANNVYANRFICHIRSQNIGYLWRHPYYELYMPVTDTIWALLARIEPLKTPLVMLRDNDPTFVNPAVFHTASIAFHLGATALVFGIARRLGFKPWPSAGAALFFGAHPLQVESVAWITGMNNLTSGFFSLLAIYLYLQQASPTGRPARYATLLLVLATIAFAVSLLSKPIATIVPLFIVIFETMILRRPFRQWIAPVLAWLILSFACVIVTHAASSESDFGSLSPYWTRPIVAGDALAFYLDKLLLPYELTFDYGLNPQIILKHWWGYVNWIAPAAVAFGLWAKWPLTHQPSGSRSVLLTWTRAGLLILFAGVLPTLGFVPYYSEAISVVSDRFVYLGMLGPALIVAAVLALPTPARRVWLLLPPAALAAFCCLTSLEVPVWANMYSLTNDMLESAPNSGMAHECYGIILGTRRQWEESLVEFRKVEQLDPIVPPTVDDAIGQSLYHLKRYDEAIAHYKEAIRREPDDNDGWFQLWLVYSQLGRLKEAEEYVRARIERYPDDDRAKFTLGLVLMQENRPSYALPYIELAAQNEPDSSDDRYYIGVIFQKLGRFKEAASYYKRALELDPTSADAAKGLTSLPAGSTEP